VTDRVAWIVGAGGLLGAAVRKRCDHQPGLVVVADDALPWDDPPGFAAAVQAVANRVVEAAQRRATSICVFWCAGSGTTASHPAQFDAEERSLEIVMSALGAAMARAGRRRHDDVLFYASSAGGVYGGAEHPPFTERTSPHPISPYGRSKLRSERIVADAAHRGGYSLAVGRISNLYGPGQRLDKPQGLVSQLALAQATGSPASVYVPLDTLRDYIHVDDCARKVVDFALRVADQDPNSSSEATKILATGRAATIGELLGLIHRLTKQRVRVVLGASPHSRLQAVDLRLRSVVMPELDEVETIPLPVGVAETISDVRWRLVSGEQSIRLGG